MITLSNASIIKQLTPYQDINDLLLLFTQEIETLLSKNLVGLYLFGSLTYGDFNPNSSDIDLVAIVHKPLSAEELEHIKQMHKSIGESHIKWRDRIECSYTPQAMLKEILPPIEPRPYIGGGIFYDKAPYGNEWIINNYLLYKHAIPLIGPEFKTLLNPIDILEVQKACIRDLFQEWEPKITDEWLNNSHYQSYFILNLCRILYTILQANTSTKTASAAWVKKEFGEWQYLIETAESWEYGKEMSRKNEAIEFIKFVINTIKQSSIYQLIEKRG